MLRIRGGDGELKIPNKNGYFILPHESVSLDAKPFLILTVRSRSPARTFIDLKGDGDVALLEQKFIIEIPSTENAESTFACDLRSLYRKKTAPVTMIIFSDVVGGIITMNDLSYSSAVPENAQLLEWDMRRFAKPEPRYPLPEIGFRNLISVINFVADPKGVNFVHKADGLLLLPRRGRFNFSILPETLGGQRVDTNILENPWLVLVYAADRKVGLGIELKGEADGKEVWLLGSNGTVAPYRKMTVSLPATGGKLRMVSLPMWTVINTAPLPLDSYNARVLAFSDVTGGPVHLAALGFSPLPVPEPSNVVRGTAARGEWVNWIGASLSIKDTAANTVRTVDAKPPYYLAPGESAYEFEAIRAPFPTPIIVNGDPFR